MKLLFAFPLLLAATMAVEAQTPSWLPPADSGPVDRNETMDSPNVSRSTACGAEALWTAAITAGSPRADG